MSLDGVADRGTPNHATLTANTVETIDLEEDFPAVEVAAIDGAVTFTVDGDDPTTSSGHWVGVAGSLSVRSQERSTGPSGVTRVKVIGATGETPRIVVTGLR